MSDERLKEDVLYAFAVEPQHDQKTLEHYIQQHPEFTEDLIELSFELRLSATLGLSEVAAEADARSEHAWQEFVACAPAKANAERSSNPFARFRGEAFATLSNSMGMPRSLLTALRDRLPEPSSIPDRTIRRLADALASSVEAVRDYLTQPPAIISTAQFKADKKPSQQGRVSFKELVEKTEMSDEERKILLQDWDDDRPSRG
ncbi:MAG: hypothetical protein WD851_15550 [Pirellulales bacterium]